MAVNMLKLERLISILVILLRKERVQAKELAEMFGVSVRTILRDVDAIDLAGIPIVTYQGFNGGIGIAKGYRLDKSILTKDEMAAIITMAKGMAGALPDKNHEILLEKLKNTLSSAQVENLETKVNQLVIDLSPWRGNQSLKVKAANIRRAIDSLKELNFIYTDSSGHTTMREVEPYSLVLKGQSWYLYGWCLMRRDLRLFKLARIKELTVTDKSYKPREISLEQLPWEGNRQRPENMIKLELVFEQEFASLAEECFGEEVCKGDDGRIMVMAEMPENNWLYGFLLSFGTGVEVINPPHIRTKLCKIGEGIYKKYLQQT
ncbi:helix-turn-helix transcriptional regulator [Desulforamulus aquiferis]|uniref:YafY family protein n=1 Tax=Desulforamulus aquiferis TaxID=1397668 RepID=A0AAW7ZDP5_9FIRM|nr:YafY family protein [Desulforamulus aquiferis]MDO7787359.1 YafY family protein [Desulforamulus aquiferis]